MAASDATMGTDRTYVTALMGLVLLASVFFAITEEITIELVLGGAAWVLSWVVAALEDTLGAVALLGVVIALAGAYLMLRMVSAAEARAAA